MTRCHSERNLQAHIFKQYLVRVWMGSMELTFSILDTHCRHYPTQPNIDDVLPIPSLCENHLCLAKDIGGILQIASKYKAGQVSFMVTVE